MDAINCIMTRASERSFSGEKIPKKDILEIIKAGMAAPSAKNVQAWSFIVLEDEKILTEISDALQNCRMLKPAGQGIVVCGVPEKDDTSKRHWMHDCSAATENILLAAHAKGYGAVWTAVHPNEERLPIVRKILKIPHHIVPFCIIPIGVIAQKSVPKDKFKEENIHWDKW